MAEFYKIPKEMMDRLLKILGDNSFLQAEDDWEEVNNDPVIDMKEELEKLMRKQKNG
jgi:hypothetical protein